MNRPHVGTRCGRRAGIRRPSRPRPSQRLKGARSGSCSHRGGQRSGRRVKPRGGHEPAHPTPGHLISEARSEQMAEAPGTRDRRMAESYRAQPHSFRTAADDERASTNDAGDGS